MKRLVLSRTFFSIFLVLLAAAAVGAQSNQFAFQGNLGSLQPWAGRPNTTATTNGKRVKKPKSDLKIKQFLFPPNNDQALRVRVVNIGKSPSGACRLVLTVRRIDGVAVGRRTHVNVPVLAAGAGVWLFMNVTSVLPNNVSLQSTTFKLNVDATEIVAESNEQNNEVWHGLSSEAVLDEPEASATQQLSAATGEQKKLSCVGVSGRWQICGSTNFKNKFVAGVGIRFNQIDPNGRVLQSRTYENCSKLAGDKTIPAYIRAQAKAPCEQSLKLAVEEAAVQ